LYMNISAVDGPLVCISFYWHQFGTSCRHHPTRCTSTLISLDNSENQDTTRTVGSLGERRDWWNLSEMHGIFVPIVIYSP
jgi:hypothetical protein